MLVLHREAHFREMRTIWASGGWVPKYSQGLGLPEVLEGKLLHAIVLGFHRQ